jgi:hypothetical protein
VEPKNPGAALGLLIFLLLGAYSVYQMASEQRPAAQQEQHTTNPSNSTAQHPSIRNKNVTPNIQSDSSSDQSDYIKKLIQVSITDILLAIFTGALVFTVGRQEWWMRKHERAYVNIGPGRQVRDRTTGTVIGLAVTLVNYGRTPAIIKEVTWGVCPISDWPVKRYPAYRVYEDILNPGMTKGEDALLGADFWSPITGADINIFYARVIYNDIFGREHFASCKHRILADADRTSVALVGSYSEGWDYDRKQKKTDPP